MANPQKENGFTAIANEIMDALVNYLIPGEQMKCLLYIIRKTYGFNKKEDMISNSQFVKATGLNKGNVSRAIKGLINKNLVIKDDNKRIPSYRFNKNYRKWKELSKKQPVIKADNSELSKMTPTKDTITKDKENIIKENFNYSKKQPLPENIFLTNEMREYVRKQGCVNSNHAENLFEDFCNHHASHGKKFKDWTRTFQTWVRNDKKWNPDIYKKILEGNEALYKEMS